MNEELLDRVVRMEAELKAGRRRNRRLALLAATMAAVYAVAQWGPAVYATIADSLFFYTKNGSGTDTARLVIPTDNVVADGNNVTMRVETSVNGSTNLQVDATSNQLLLGGGNGGSTSATTTLSATTPAASLTYTIPDAGGAANVILSTTSAGTAQSLTTGTTGSMSIDTGTTGAINVGTNNGGAKTITIGFGNAATSPTSIHAVNGRLRIPNYTTGTPSSAGAAAGELFYDNNTITASTSGTENTTARLRMFDSGTSAFRSQGATLLLSDAETAGISIATANAWYYGMITGATSVTTSDPGIYVLTWVIYLPAQNNKDWAFRLQDTTGAGTTRASCGFRAANNSNGITVYLVYEKTTSSSETLAPELASNASGSLTNAGPTVAGVVQSGYVAQLVRYAR